MIQTFVSVEQMPGIISERFGVPPSTVSVRSIEEGNDVRWTSNGISYELTVQASHIVLARVTYEKVAPSGQRILECLGVPDKYWAHYFPMPTLTQRLTQLNLFYPAIGAACWMNKYGSGDRPPSFAPTDTVVACDFVPSTPAEQVILRILNDLTAPSAVKWVEDRLQDWPADWRDIVVETEPFP